MNVSGGGVNITTNTGHDIYGNVLYVQNGKGIATNYTYDFYGRKTQTKNPAQDPALGAAGASSSTTVYGAGINRTATTTNELGQVIRNTYDQLGYIVKSEDIAGTPITLKTCTYDMFMRPATETDARGAVTTYTYDSLDRLTDKKITNGSYGPLLYEESYKYETVYPISLGATQKVTKTVATDNAASSPPILTTSYTDAMGNTIMTGRVIDKGERDDAYVLDYLGNKTSAKTADGYITSYKYQGSNMC